MNEKINELRLNTIDGVVSAIEQMVKDKQDKPSPLMIAAFGGVLDLLEQHVKRKPSMAPVLDQVRDAVGIQRNPKQETIA
jgi:DNA-binding FrmR family transcriptional regulator